MIEVPDTKCGYTWPTDHEVGDDPKRQSCCYRDTVEGAERCLWHGGPELISKRSGEDLKELLSNSAAGSRYQLAGEVLDGAKLVEVDLPDSMSFQRVSLRNADLTAADLRGADLADADLHDTNLTDTDLRETDLTGATLRGADLTGANLCKADLPNADLRSVNLTQADLENANLTGADLRYADLTSANLANADISDVSFYKSNLSRADFQNTDLAGANFSGTDLSKVSFNGTNLLEADLGDADLPEVDFEGVDLTEEDLRGVDLSDATLNGADLSKSDLSGSDLTNKDFEGATLANADLRNTDLLNANLKGSDLTDSNLRGADLTGADLRDADLAGSNLRGAKLSNTIVQNTDLSNISVDGSTECEQLYEQSNFMSTAWDATARGYHDLKSEFAEHGLVEKARRHHIHERRARRLEAKATSGRLSGDYLGGLASAVFTGYGVRPSRLAIWMVGLFVISTAVYLQAGVQDSLIRTLSYSVVTFTTTPPGRPDGTILQLVVMAEAFLGTLSLITLGYIFGNRERF